MRDLNGDKALGPDSFTIAFFPKVLGGNERGPHGSF